MGFSYINKIKSISIICGSCFVFTIWIFFYFIKFWNDLIVDFLEDIILRLKQKYDEVEKWEK